MPDLSLQAEPLPPPEDWRRKRRTLARKWAYVLAEANYVPLVHADFEAELIELLDQMCAAVHSDPADTGPAAAAGARLVELNCADDRALATTMDVLGPGLLALPEFPEGGAPAERVVQVLGALAVGFVGAAQQATLAQQESMQRSLLKAVRDAKWNLRAAEARFEEVATSSASGILITGLDGELVTVNASAGAILGYSPAELTEGNLFDLVDPERAPALREDYAALREGRLARIKQSQRLLRRDGDHAMVSLTASLLRGADEAPDHFVTVVEDGTELALLQNELSRQSLHDVLTGLPNRQFFGTQLEIVLRQADRRYGVTLLHLDLDGYAVVRDGLGERAAEQLLVVAAQRLKSVLAGQKAMVARFDGAEFAVLLENSPTTPELVSLVHAIRRELAEPSYVDGHGTAPTASVGVVHLPSPERTPEDVLRGARQALRRAKAGGGGQWELFHPEHERLDRQRDALAATMPGAFENGSVEARYQPLVRLAEGTVAGVEALVCWEHAEFGPLPDRQCRELAERTGLMPQLGEWLLRASCAQVAWWRQRLGRELLLTLNLTAHQAADPDLVTRLLGVLEQTGFPAARLLLELPAPALAADHGESRDNLRTLTDLGVRTALRDFGPGTANLAAVTDLAVDFVRVNRELVGRELVPGSPVTEALRQLPRLAHQAGVSVIVDGVTTAEQAEFWLAAGADLACGDYFGGAGRPDELAAGFGDPAWQVKSP
ncbi:EAL domain-containing protein [Crossiella sp. CA-258035]|uniref:putative bifunctional diguanylate cyclase/phosphodiesterase n=1 Tax=Crossiella sp. CA-258035 TaxID=2981138 RepID=UPI0024BC4D6D|nr:EAL domain-containing protein [Crossiella sp. CA-258035]WHT19317.1 EAL domain-containing protein [Crossiella sp. CA-258035]